jgi:hypothetical protein
VIRRCAQTSTSSALQEPRTTTAVLRLDPPQPDKRTEWARAQNGGSALHRLYESTAEAAETLITQVRHLKMQPDGSHNKEVISSGI